MPAAPPELSPAELARYSRQILLPGIGADGQRRLAAARVLVIGAGGLGSPAALYLAAAGVGTLGLADFDRVEAHNLPRQLLHDDAAIGAPKVESAARRLAAANPAVKLPLHREGVTAANALALFRDYDLIVDGTDNFPARYLNNDAACFARKPLVYGSIFKFEGQVTVFDPARGGPCYRCLFPAAPPPGAVPNCGEAGVIGALCGVIGSLQAMEAVKCLLGLGDSLRGRLLVFDALAAQFRTLRLPRDPACPLCGDAPAIRELRAETGDLPCSTPLPTPAPAMHGSDCPLEISIEETKLLLERDPTVTLLDVREPFETAICRIAGSTAIPMAQVSARLATLPKDRRLLVHCHHGGRSLRVTQFLRAQGYAAVSNVAGGIDAWAQKFDPAMRRY